MTQEHPDLHTRMATQAGFTTLASAGLLSKCELYDRLGVGWQDVNAFHAAAIKARKDAVILEKSILTRASPLLPNAIRLGLKHPDVSLQDYEEWFGGRALQYASPGEVSSMFSPAAYLTELYREARGLYKDTSLFHIDNRRPDLKNLVLSQDNMSQEVMALTLSNEILMEKTRTAMKQGDNEPGDDDVMQALSTHVSSSNTPYHLHHNRLRQVCLQKDPDFRQMLAAPNVLGHLSGPTLAGVYYDIPPALYQLLTEKIPEDEAEQKAMFERNFGECLLPEALLNPKTLRSWYGLTDDEINSFLYGLRNGEYVDNILTTSVNNKICRIKITQNGGGEYFTYLRIKPLGSNRWNLAIKFKAMAFSNHLFRLNKFNTSVSGIEFDSKSVGDEKFIVGKEYSFSFTYDNTENLPTQFIIQSYRHQTGGGGFTFSHTVDMQILEPSAYLLKLNKAIRLYKATGLPPHVLEDIVNSVDPNQINDDTLTLLFRTALLMKHYNVSHEDAMMMSRGNISQSVRGYELSQFDRLFNNPALSEAAFYPDDNKTIQLELDKADEDAEIKAALKRACGTDDDGMIALWLIYSSASTDYKFYLNLKDISGLYAISLWARTLSLSPQELRQLLTMLGLKKELYKASVNEWNALFVRAGATVEWLNARGLTVADLALMTREVKDIPAGTDINNFLDTLRAAAAATELPTNPELADYALPLAPPLSAALNLPGDALSSTLLLWANAAKPGDKTLAEFWDILTKIAPTVEETAAATAFAYGLAQMALIVHATGVTPDALALFVAQPDQLSGAEPDKPKTVLLRSAEVVMALDRFSSWFRTLPDPAGAGAALVTSLKAVNVTPALLAQATGLSAATVTQAAAEAKKTTGVVDAAKLASWLEISTVLEWLALAQTFGVMPSDIGRMLALNYPSGTSAAATWADWKRAADAFSTALSPVQQRAAEQDVAARLSGALSGYLLSANVLTGTGGYSREALFTYLLSDNLNGPQVMTSRLAEAIASLQIFIHRTLSLAPDSPEANALVREVLDRQFFRDWTQWNARYSNWAAGRKLMYYPENYIDPTMRLGQTRMMDDMLQVLGQAQINTDTVGDAFMGYLTGFEEVANLETVSGYHDSTNPDEGKTWFVGRNQSTPREYWWRSVDEGKRSPEGTLPANAWTGWSKISVAPQPAGRLIRPVIYKERLYLGWIERNRHVTARNDVGKEVAWEHRWELKVSWLRYDGGWSQPAVYTYTTEDVSNLEELLKLGSQDFDSLSLYLSAWPEKQLMIAGVYKKSADSDQDAKSFTGETLIYEDMTFEATNFASANWTVLKKMLDDDVTSRVLPPFTPSKIKVENRLTSPSRIPGGFTRFDAINMIASVVDLDSAGSTYKLRVAVTQVVNFVKPEIQNNYIDTLIFCFPELQADTSRVEVLHAGKGSEYNGSLGAFLVREEAGQWWAYFAGKLAYWDNVRFSDASLPIEDSGELISADGSPIGRAYYAKFKVNGGSMRLILWRDGRQYQTLYPPDMVALKSIPTIQSFITPAAYFGTPLPDIIPGGQITCQVSGGGGDSDVRYVHGSDLPTDAGSATLQWPSGCIYPVPQDKTFTFSGNEVIHTLTLSFGSGNNRTWEFRVYKDIGEHNIDTIGMEESAQYLEHSGTRTRLNTLFARQLTEKAVSGIDTILNFDTQLLPEPPLKDGNGTAVMDFSGANAIYFWELFYYTPMMVMQRFLQEERFDMAEKWLKYVFSPSGYIVHGVPYARMWNVRPLQEDTSWNDEPLASNDPDAVAQNDPMHYKLNAFMRLLDITIGRGDTAYRKLERDTLAEAKAWYGRALSLLGEAPWIEPGSGWTNPQLGSTASETVLNDRLDALSLMAKGIRRSADISLNAVFGSTMFLPEANEVMLGYWETLRIRLYNLRHNLTIDGQPMNLLLFAAPTDPKALLAAAVAAEGGAGSKLPDITSIPALRFTPMLESARSMASQLIQFGSSMQQVLLAQDAEALAELLTTQGAAISASGISLQKQTLEELAAERITLAKVLDTATVRRNHYQNLYEQNINTRETQAMDLLTASQTTAAGAKGLLMAGAAAGVVPNIFGLANGGMKYEGPLNAAGIGITIAADALSIAGTRMAQEEQYRRRREEWGIQYRTAEKEMQGIEAQLSALSVRKTSAQMQIAHMETQLSHAQAQLALFQSKYTSKTMYGWLRGRLATIFYQYYDLTASLCLMAQKSLQWEKDDTTSYLKTGTWNGAWAGLMSGEGLMLSLAQMEMAWMKHQKRELEVTRTVSLAAFLAGRLGDGITLPGGVKSLLNKDSDSTIGGGDNKLALSGKQLAVHFSLKDLGLMADYAAGSKGRVRSIAVTLPALLGPYQNIRGRLRTDATTLPSGCNECAISHAMQDNGLFVNDGSGDPRWGARWLPFEGLDVSDTNSNMTLSFADATGDQKALLESLSDIILHVQFTVR